MIYPSLLLLVFLAVFATIMSFGQMLRHLQTRDSPPDDSDDSIWVFSAWHLLVRMIAEKLPGSPLERLRESVARDLVRAASPKERTADLFLGQALLEGAALALLAGLAFKATTGSFLLLLSLGLGVLHSLGLRPQLLRSAASERIGRISRQLPYAIDLAVLVLSAGGTLREALSVICERSEDEPLQEELAQALAEVEGGATLGRALNGMAERLAMDDLTSLVIAITRGEDLGASMKDTLRVQAEIFRHRRLQKAERLAVEAPVKMMFPNMLIMVAVILIVLGPIVLELMTKGLI